MKDIKLNRNLVLIKKQLNEQQTIDGIIIPGKITGMVSYGTIVAHGGSDTVQGNNCFNQEFVKAISPGRDVCYYNNRQTELLMENNSVKYYLINVMDIIYID